MPPYATLEPALVGLGLFAGICWVLSLVFDEHGWIDRPWSITPIAYMVGFCIGGGATPRLLVMTGLVAAWGIRLTYNFARKGGYRLGGEDYRWNAVRAGMGKAAWAVFNVIWICLLQNAILLGQVLPGWYATAPGAPPWGWLDSVATALFVLFLIGEAVADEQQWRFQQQKKAKRARGEPVGKGFLTTGLFRYSRHPNFFCEMGMWWSFYLFSIAAGAPLLNVSGLGALVLTLQFQGSTNLTEKLSLEKYPDYAEYQKTTSRILPGPPGG